MTDGVLIVGANRVTGLEAARLLAVRSEPVTAFARPTSDTAGLVQVRVKQYKGDVLDPRSAESRPGPLAKTRL